MAKGGKLLKLKSVLKKWNSFSKSNRHSNSSISSSTDDNDVVSSHSSLANLHAVYVGKSRRCYLVGADVINHPLFKELVERSNEYDDSINVVCEVVMFEHLLWMLENVDPQPETMNELVEFYVC